MMNAANEIAVAAFLEERIRFVDLPDIIARVMSRCPAVENPSLADVLAADGEARRQANQAIEQMKRG